MKGLKSIIGTVARRATTGGTVCHSYGPQNGEKWHGVPLSRKRRKYHAFIFPSCATARQIRQIFCDAKTWLRILSNPFFSLHKTLFERDISPRCGSCDLFWDLAFKHAGAGRRAAVQRAVAAYVDGVRRGVVLGGAVLALTATVLAADSASAQSGWSQLSTEWVASERPKIAALTPRLSSGSWTSNGSFDERALPSTPGVDVSAWKRPPQGSRLEGLRKLIKLAESPRRGYDAIHWSAKMLPKKKPTEMTISEILAWIEATPRQHHAIGQYQIIPSTLKMLLARSGLSPATKFTPEVQDRLGDILIADAGYNEFVAGKLSASNFMNNLAKIWAGFPMANGRSAYHGKAGNKASFSRAFMEREMARIFAPSAQAALSE